jgi:hypothetical protein
MQLGGSIERHLTIALQMGESGDLSTRQRRSFKLGKFSSPQHGELPAELFKD